MTESNDNLAAASKVIDKYGLFLNGEWRKDPSLPRLDVINPATEQPIGQIPCAGPSELNEALASARDGFEVWRHTHAWERAAVLRKTADWIRSNIDLCSYTMSLEQGKALAEATREFGMAADHFEWASEEAKRITDTIVPARPAGTTSTLRHLPVGVVAAFTPWNFPALIVAAKAAYALAAGCSVILKPSEETPGTAMLIVQALQESGLPGGVLNMVMGVPAEISGHLLSSPSVNAGTFTGSTAVGKLLMGQAAQMLIPMTMELGGHAPVIVYPDVDPKKAAETAAGIKFRNAGQACVSPSRFYVHQDIAEPFTESMVAYAESLVVGPGTDPKTTMGPMSNSRRVEAANAFVQDAIEKGATLRTGGAPPKDQNKGYYFCPTVLSDVSDDSRIMIEEPFAPIAPIKSFSDSDDVIGWANNTEYGLAGYVMTEDPKRAAAVSDRLETGMVAVNNFFLAMAETPFGGVKQSGFGREGGPDAIDEFLVTKLVKTLS